MGDSGKSDIAQEILSKTIDEFEGATKGLHQISNRLRDGIQSGKLEDDKWVLDALKLDLSKEIPKGVEVENPAPEDKKL